MQSKLVITEHVVFEKLQIVTNVIEFILCRNHISNRVKFKSQSHLKSRCNHSSRRYHASNRVRIIVQVAIILKIEMQS